MAKIILSTILLLSLYARSDFKTQCLACHREEAGPDMYNVYLQYLHVYGSNKRAKEAMFNFLKDPKVERSIMKMEVITRYGIHPSLSFKDQQLRHLIDRYIEFYDVKKRIKINP